MQGPPAITTGQVAIARVPELGGEVAVFLTLDPAIEMGNYQIVAANSGLWTPDPIANTLLAAAPGGAQDIILMVDTSVNDTGPIVFTVAGLDANGAPLSGPATVKTPSYAQDQLSLFQPGWAADVVVAAGSQFSKILSVSVAATAQTQYARARLFAMPNINRYQLMGYVMEKDITTRAQEPIAIPQDLDGSKDIKGGMIPAGGVRLTSRFVGAEEGLARFDGARCTVRMDINKERSVLTGRMFALGGWYKHGIRAGDGAAVAEADGQILCKAIAMIPAQGP